MCGRTTLTITADDLQRTFGFAPPPGYRPRFNIAPSQPVLAIRDLGRGPRLEEFRWGLIPFWADDTRIGSRLVNARAETVATKRAFREAFARRRCLIIVDGYYEWQASPWGKRPHRVKRRDDGAFTLAGVWERWSRGPELVESCAIITSEASALIAPLHDRMPVIIAPIDREAWLSAETDPHRAESLLRPCPGEELVVYEVSTLVNDPKVDVAECIEPIEEPLTLF